MLSSIRFKITLITLPCFVALFSLFIYQQKDLNGHLDMLNWINTVEEPVSTEIYHLREAFAKESDAVLDYLQDLKTKPESNEIIEQAELNIGLSLEVLESFPNVIPSNFLMDIKAILAVEDELRLKLFAHKDKGIFKNSDDSMSGLDLQITKFDRATEKIHDWFSVRRKQNYQTLLDHQVYEKKIFNIIFGLGLILTLALVWLVSNFINKPVMALTNTIQKIEKGDLTARSPITTSDEIGVLAKTFNHMLDSLLDAQSQLSNAAKLSALGEVAGNIAHEINNPLTTIMARAHRLEKSVNKDHLVKEELLKEILSIIKTSNIIANIVKSLKAFSRDSENDPMEKTPICKIMEDSLELVHERYKMSQTTLKMDCDPHFVIQCHSSQILQILVNLLGNSLDAIEKEKERWVEVKVSYAPENNSLVWIRITDSGKGIPPEILAKLLTPFFTTKAIGKGTGLGLTISRKIIESHGGRLFYEKNGENTSFVVELPLVAQKSSLEKKTVA